MVCDDRHEFVCVGRVCHVCDCVESMFFPVVFDILLEGLKVTALVKLGLGAFDSAALTFRLG